MRSADLTPLGRDAIHRSAGAGFIFVTFLVAYSLSAIPWTGAWMLAHPDFVLLALLFWSLNEPRNVGQGVAFLLGLLMDVSDSMLLGQHAFAYVIAVFIAQTLRVRILSFTLPEQSLYVAGLFATSAGVMLLLNLLLGAQFPGFAFLLSPVLGAVLWGPASWLAYHPMMRRSHREASS